jgi:hypothetical protein
MASSSPLFAGCDLQGDVDRYFTIALNITDMDKEIPGGGEG